MKEELRKKAGVELPFGRKDNSWGPKLGGKLRLLSRKDNSWGPKLGVKLLSRLDQVTVGDEKIKDRNEKKGESLVNLKKRKLEEQKLEDKVTYGGDSAMGKAWGKKRRFVTACRLGQALEDESGQIQNKPFNYKEENLESADKNTKFGDELRRVDELTT